MPIKFTIAEKNDLQCTYDVKNVYRDADFLPVASEIVEKHFCV